MSGMGSLSAVNRKNLEITHDRQAQNPLFFISVMYTIQNLQNVTK